MMIFSPMKMSLMSWHMEDPQKLQIKGLYLLRELKPFKTQDVKTIKIDLAQ